MEKAIIKINKFAFELYIQNDMITPFISDMVMKKEKEIRHQKHYEKFPDGLHPGEELYEHWGNLISERVNTNFSRFMGRLAGRHSACRKRPLEEKGTASDEKRAWKTY